MVQRDSSVITRRHQLTAAVVLVICLVIMAVSRKLEYARRGRPIDIERAFDVPSATLKIELNTASWPELTLLPEISETMARRIVQYRDSAGGFSTPEDIQNVSGIGPRTFARIEPYLSHSVPLKPR